MLLFVLYAVVALQSIENSLPWNFPKLSLTPIDINLVTQSSMIQGFLNFLSKSQSVIIRLMTWLKAKRIEVIRSRKRDQMFWGRTNGVWQLLITLITQPSILLYINQNIEIFLARFFFDFKARCIKKINGAKASLL